MAGRTSGPSLGSPTIAHLLNGLEPGTTCHYHLTASNGIGTASYSDAASATTASASGPSETRRRHATR